MRWVILAGLLLTACAREEPVPEVVSYRDRSVPIASQVDVAFDQFVEGRYQVRLSTDQTTAGLTARFSDYLDSTTFVIDAVGDCPPPDICHQWSSSLTLEPSGPGRFAIVSTTDNLGVLQGRITGTLWILWADADRRTLAVGNPEGTFGFILDRETTGGEDRIAAARDIMEWMGYRVDEMVSP